MNGSFTIIFEDEAAGDDDGIYARDANVEIGQDEEGVWLTVAVGNWYTTMRDQTQMIGRLRTLSEWAAARADELEKPETGRSE